jgi:hypothetical protein
LPGNEQDMLAPSARWWILVLAPLSALGDSSALADPAEAVRFSYEAAASCPKEAQFVEAVLENGGPFAHAAAGAPAREIRVRIAQGDHVTGQVVVRDRTGTEAVRTIVGERCEDVAGALAVLVSLTLEPAAAAPEPAAMPSPAPAARATSAARAEVVPPSAERPAAPEALPPGWRLGASAGGTVSGLGSMGLGVAAYVEVIRDVRDGFAPALRLGVELAHGDASVATSGASGPNNDTVSLSQRLVRLDACPLRAVAMRPWSPAPIEAWACARLDAGVLDAIASNLPGATNMQRAWMAAGSLVHVRWVVRRFFVDLEGGIVVPLLRERFYVEPSTGVYQVPTVTGAGGLALGVYFL